MYKNSLPKLKIREILLVVVMLFMFFYSYPLVKTKTNRFRTLNSLKAIGKKGVYTMKYELDYKLDAYLKNGSKNINQLYDFIDRNTSLPFTFSESSSFARKDLYDIHSYNEYDECSAFSAFDNDGNALFCRNLDIKGSHPILVLFTKPPRGYASISVVEIPILGCTDNNDELRMMFKQYSNRTPLLRSPYMPRDGMNEKGLSVATLNVPGEEIVSDPSLSTIGRWQVLRMLLDKASNVKEAIELLKEYNCFDGTVHYFISDAYGSSIVAEYVQGKLCIIPSLDNFQVVTNFYLSQEDKNGKGHIRYSTAYDYLKEKNGTLDGASALKLLCQVKEPSTAYSVVYNQGTGEVFLAYNGDYESLYNFKLKME